MVLRAFTRYMVLALSLILVLTSNIQAASVTKGTGSSSAPAQRSPSKQAFVPGQLLIKFKSQGPQAVLVCAHCWVSQHKSFQHATADKSDSLDRLNALTGLISAEPLFSSRHDLTQAGVDKQNAQRAVLHQKHFPRHAKRVHEAKPVDLGNIYVLTFSADQNIEHLVELYANDPHVEYVQPNFIYTATALPNDPYFSSSNSWGQGYEDLWGLKKIAADKAWDLTMGAGVTVAVIDTGLDINHEDIAANVYQNPAEIANNQIDDDGNGLVDDVSGWDFVANDNLPQDQHGHGTHVSGTIAAVGNNNKGIIGVASQAEILPVRVLDGAGNGTNEQIARGIVYAAMRGADVINNSWGCPIKCDESPVLRDAFQAAYNMGSLSIFASGNSNGEIKDYSPVHLNHIINVGSVDHNDERSSFSNYGYELTVTAPGGDNTNTSRNANFINVLSLRAAGTNFYKNTNYIVNEQYYRSQGTSMAAPHVAGLAALIMAYHPDFTLEQVRQAIISGADDIGDVDFDTKTGYGRINAFKSLKINSPLESIIFGFGSITNEGQLPIYGSVSGEGLLQWMLEYKHADGSDDWQMIESSFLPIINDTLTMWNLSGVSDGEYIVRLTATKDNFLQYYSYARVNLNNMIIKSPNPDEIAFIKSGEKLIVKGTIAPGDFDHYEVLVQDRIFNTLTDAKLTVPQSGQHIVLDDVLAEWDTQGVKTNQYSLIFRIYLTNGLTVDKVLRVIVDQEIKTNWPRSLNNLTGESGGTILKGLLTTADINGDGASELIFGFGTKVHVINAQGQSLPGWPQVINNFSTVPVINVNTKKLKLQTKGINVDPSLLNSVIASSPIVGDLDGDGVPEVVAVNSNNEIFVWDATGHLRAGWPKRATGYSGGLAMADVDGDGYNDIIAVGGNRIDVLNRDGIKLSGWPKLLEATVELLQPAVGDMDGDGKAEIVVFDSKRPSNVYVFNNGAQLLPGWPKAINPLLPVGTKHFSQPVLGDVDNDGKLEVVVASTRGEVNVFKLDGSSLAGWPRQIEPIAVNTPILGDVDGDGLLDIIASTINYNLGNDIFKDYLYVWNKNGQLLPGWPVVYDVKGVRSWGISGLALADLNNDGYADVLASSDSNVINAVTAIQGFDQRGQVLPGFPRVTKNLSHYIDSTFALADFDGDGSLDMAWVDLDGQVYIWDMHVPSVANRPWPMFNRDSQHRGVASNPNHAPSLDFIADQEVEEGQLLSFTLSGQDIDVSQTLTFFINDLPQGALFDPLTNVFSWTPELGQLGEYDLECGVSDGQLMVKQKVHIKVKQGSGLPDLVINGVSLPSQIITGQTVPMHFDVRNLGLSKAPKAKISLFISTDSDITTTDTRLSAIIQTDNELLPNGVESKDFDITIPSKFKPGTYYIGLIVDEDGSVPESREDNNVGVSPIKVELVSGVDLTGIITTNTDLLSLNGTLNISSQIINKGPGRSVGFFVRYFLSTDNQIDPEDIVLGQSYINKILGNAQLNNDLTVVVPDKVKAGKYHLLAFVDFTQLSNETDEANNQIALPKIITVGVSGDLTHHSVLHPNQVTREVPFNVTDTVKNIGTDTVNSFYVAVYLSTDANITSQDRYLGRRLVNSLPAGSSHTGFNTITIPNIVRSGDYYIGVIVDSMNIRQESNENNNASLGTPITVQ